MKIAPASRTIRTSFLLLALLVSSPVLLTGGTAPTTAAPLHAPPEGFAHPAIRQLWERDERGVGSGATWMWGPGPFYTNYEPFAGLPQGNHLVQYFDKGRLEINDPTANQNSPWFVTSGLLVQEMVTGKVQVGERETLDLGPARIGVVGDHAAWSPTYGDFLIPPRSDRAADATGRTIGCWFLGGDSLDPMSKDTPEELNLRLARYEPASGHNWAEPFWRYASTTLRDRWLHVLGYPISEPCGVVTTIDGNTQNVLVQLFERRVLTYNPSNPSATQVEMGNVGRHYYLWRYANLHPATFNAKYQAKIIIGPAPSRATQVQQTVEITNGTNRPLPNAIFRAPWRHHDGVFTLKSATVDGASATPRWLHGINLEVTLPRALQPRSKATINLSFELRPRPVGGRNGYDRANDILNLGDMLPTLVPWENGGWSYYPYSDLGDLGYYDVSDYSVEIASSGGERLVVGGTGQVTHASPDGTLWRFSAPGARDVAYVVSPRFANPLEDPGMARQEGKVKMLAYFRPQQRANGQRQLQLTAPALKWFSDAIGPYPFDTYMIAEMGVPLERTDNYAQEYPMTYLVPSPWLQYGTEPGNWTWYIPVHEVGHQWFYSTVGSNQLTDPWLDEALTTYLTAEYVRLNHPQHYPRAWDQMTRGAIATRPVSSGVFSGFANEDQYSRTVYNSGALMLDRVRRAMGDQSFYAALRDYYATYRHKRATPNNLLHTLQKHSKADLKPIFSEYLGY